MKSNTPAGAGADVRSHNLVTDAMRDAGYPHSHTDSSLLTWAIKTANVRGRRGPRWAAVMRVFKTGQTTAMALCRAVGVDPDELVGHDDPGCEACA